MPEPKIIDKEKGIVQYGEITLVGHPSKIIRELRSRGWKGTELLGFSLSQENGLYDGGPATQKKDARHELIVRARMSCSKYDSDEIDCRQCTLTKVGEVSSDLIGTTESYRCIFTHRSVILTYKKA